MIRGVEPPQSGRLRRQHFVQSFALSRRLATEMVNPNTAAADLTTRMQLFCAVARYSPTSRTRIAVVGNGNTDVGSKTLTRESGQPIIERLTSSGFPDLRIDIRNGLKPEGARKCGAMSEQSADSGRGNEQVPQKLVHLVGYRDPNAGPDPWIRPRPIPVKR
jgi:hypothetical protein